MAMGRIARFALLAIRLGLGTFLLFWTTLVAGIIGQLAFGHVPFGTRCLLVLLSLFFALQAYAVCRILLFRSRPPRPVLLWPPPGPPPDWPVGTLVPAPPSGSPPTLAEAQALPR